MYISVKVKLLFGLLIIGIVYGVTFHTLLAPVFASQLVHCVVSGILFGFTSSFLGSLLYNKYCLVKEHNRDLCSQLRTDKLTQLLNRKALDDDVNLQRIIGEVISVIFIDIDEFRTINNNYGHLAGDTILKKVSNVITENIRVTDLAYRYGGEEMVVLLNNCTKASALEVAEKIRTRISELDNLPYPKVTISLGVASYPEDADDLLSVIKKSDNALLNAKKQGKNRVFLSV